MQHKRQIKILDETWIDAFSEICTKGLDKCTP